MRQISSIFVRPAFGLEMALGSIAGNRLRSVLTIVGVAIGVAAVVALVAIGEGARLSIVRQFESLGTNLIKIESHHWRARLLTRDALDLELRVPSITRAMPVVKAEAKVRWRNKTDQRKILGTTEDFPYIRDHEVVAGRFFCYLHVKGRQRVAVVGWNLVDDLFGGRNPVNQQIYIGGERFRVIGVLDKKGKGMAEDIDDKIVIPVTTAQRLTHNYRVNEIWAKSPDPASADLSVVHLSRIFRKKFKIQDQEPAEEVPPEMAAKMGYAVGPRPVRFYQPGRPAVRVEMPGGRPQEGQPVQPTSILTITSLNEMVEEASKANRVMTLMLAGIASVSLLVGGLGIMNIMLVSVSERTSEIGLRKALGATRGDLLYQFLLEAFLLSGIGGILGILLGRAGAGFLGNYSIEAVITAGASWVALGAAMVVGLAFGVYPAYLASGLSPVEALRH